MPNSKAMTINPAAPDARGARQARRQSGLRTNSAAICAMLLVQYGLGMGVNLYARVPSADQGSGLAVAIGHALTSQPVVLTVHTALGLLMLVAGISVLVPAVRRSRPSAGATDLTEREMKQEVTRDAKQRPGTATGPAAENSRPAQASPTVQATRREGFAD